MNIKNNVIFIVTEKREKKIYIVLIHNNIFPLDNSLLLVNTAFCLVVKLFFSTLQREKKKFIRFPGVIIIPSTLNIEDWRSIPLDWTRCKELVLGENLFSFPPHGMLISFFFFSTWPHACCQGNSFQCL